MPHINLGRKRPSKERYVNKVNLKVYNSSRWRNVKELKLRMNPLCQECEKKGLTIIAYLVHHIKPWQLGRDEAEQQQLIYDFDNLQSLCLKCHNEIHKGTNHLNRDNK